MTPEENQASSDREIKIAVASMFEKLMKDKNVVLFIDDFQWIDEKSKDLLDYLLEEFIENDKRSEEENHIAFIFTKRISEEESEKEEGWIAAVSEYGSATVAETTKLFGT